MGAYLVSDDDSSVDAAVTRSPPQGPWHASLSTIKQQLPQVKMSTILSYLAKATHQHTESDKFRALTRGHNLWKSKHVSQVAVHLQDTALIWVKSVVYASYKKEKRTTHIAFGGMRQAVEHAHCNCPAGLSASCTHVSATLWALYSLWVSESPSTSTSCSWIQPRRLNVEQFEVRSQTMTKHEIGKSKRVHQYVTAYDPRPPRFQTNIPSTVISKLCRELNSRAAAVGKIPACFSLAFSSFQELKDVMHEIPPSTAPSSNRQTHSSATSSTKQPAMSQACLTPIPPNAQSAHLHEADNPTGSASAQTSPAVLSAVQDLSQTDHDMQLLLQGPQAEDLKRLCEEKRASLTVTLQERNQIECDTRGQADNEEWYRHRQHRVTASNFGKIIKLRASTSPTSLLKSLLGYTTVPKTLPALMWGKTHEATARHTATARQIRLRHQEYKSHECGLFIDLQHCWLAASPDALVHDPSETPPEGLMEIKCPYAQRTKSVEDACKNKSFCCSQVNGKARLKRNHNYYYQVQGQLAATSREWCDFVIWTTVNCSIERIAFDGNFWRDECLPKLETFYSSCFLPEVVYPRISLGVDPCDFRSK